MGYEVNTEGFGSEWYEQGSASNAVLLEAFMTEGFFFEFVAGMELTVLGGFGIDWHPWAKHVELHGVFHWRTAFSDGWNEKTTNFTATSVASHCQTVNGFTRWTNNGNFALVVPAAASSISLIAEAADGDIGRDGSRRPGGRAPPRRRPERRARRVPARRARAAGRGA